jgi:hypothetical protein
MSEITDKALSNLYRNARALYGQRLPTRNSAGAKVLTAEVTAVRFHRKPLITDSEVVLRFRLKFKDKRSADLTFKTPIV